VAQILYILVTIKPLLIANYHTVHIIYMSYMICYSLAVEYSEGYFGDDDDHSSDEDYEPSFNLSIR
jgi:hypothetical protein